MTNQMEDKVRDILQIILSTAENHLKEIKWRKEAGFTDSSSILLDDLERIARKTRELAKLLFGKRKRK